jgi:hypothetical protein
MSNISDANSPFTDQHAKTNYGLILIVFFAVIVIGILAGGYFLFNKKVFSPISFGKTVNNPNILNILTTATINGTILQVNNNFITVKNSEGITTELELDSKVNIMKPLSENETTKFTISTDLRSIETGKNVVITLKPVDRKYRAVVINYVAPARANQTNNATSSGVSR